MLLQRTREGNTRISHLDALRWATEGGARCLGRDDIGRLAPGLQADLALFRLDQLRHSGYHDPLAALIHSGTHRADDVMVQGRWAVRDAQAVNVEQADLMQRHHAAARDLRRRAGLES